MIMILVNGETDEATLSRAAPKISMGNDKGQTLKTLPNYLQGQQRC